MEKKINLKERIALVKSMDFICRNINDEDVFMPWLSVGVADGDIPYNTLIDQVTEDEIENLEYYVDDNEAFGDLMACFLRRMARAKKSGGLYCNWVCSIEDDITVEQANEYRGECNC